MNLMLFRLLFGQDKLNLFQYWIASQHKTDFNYGL